MQKLNLLRPGVLHCLHVYFCFCVWLVTYTFFSDLFLNTVPDWIEYLITNFSGVLFIPSELSWDSLVELSNLIGRFISITLACTMGYLLSRLPPNVGGYSVLSLSLQIGLGYLGASFLTITYMAFGEIPLWRALLNGLTLLIWYVLWDAKGAKKKLCLIAVGSAVAITGLTGFQQVQVAPSSAIPAVLIFLLVILSAIVWWRKGP